MSRIFQNPSSARATKVNLLDSRVRTFRQNYSQSIRRTQTKSNIHTLASTVYSNKYNKTFHTPSKRPHSTHNPEKSSSTTALKGLDMRASHIPNMSDINTELLMQKRNLEDRILMLKEQIAKETRMRNRAQTAWKSHRNHQQYTMQAYNDHCSKSSRLNEAINLNKQQNHQLRSDIKNLQQQRQDTNKMKMQQQRTVDELQNRVNVLKNNLLLEERARNNTKNDLLKSQRVMESCSIETKELQNQRAMVLLEINQTVLVNKL